MLKVALRQIKRAIAEDGSREGTAVDLNSDEEAPQAETDDHPDPGELEAGNLKRSPTAGASSTMKQPSASSGTSFNDRHDFETQVTGTSQSSADAAEMRSGLSLRKRTFSLRAPNRAQSIICISSYFICLLTQADCFQLDDGSTNPIPRYPC